MAGRLVRVFSGSCMSLDDMDYHLPQLIPREHVLGPGIDHFDESGEPQRPQQSCHAMTKVFSGSALDLNSMNPDEEEEGSVTPVGSSKPTAGTGSPAAGDQTLSTILERINEESERQKAVEDKSKTTVLVIGGAGFLGSHIVTKLLDAGYTVKATVSNTAQVKELFTGVADAHRLTVAEANMRSPMAFKEILKGCHFVIHCGVPTLAVTDSIADAHLATVKALFDAIRMYGKSTVKRVVISGSAATVCSHSTPSLPGNALFDEQNWNDKVSEKEDPFVSAKVLFEKEAWRLRELHDIPLCVVLPSIMIGPSFTQEVSEAMRLLQSLALGSSWFPFAADMVWSFVDVRDVAEAHIKAIEYPRADSQRYLVSGHVASLPELGTLIRRTHPHLLAPTRRAPNWLTLLLGPCHSRVSLKYLWNNLGKRRQLNIQKAQKELSFSPQPLEATVRDAVAELIAAGHLPSPNDPSAAHPHNGGVYVAVGLLAALAAGGVFLLRRRR